jgi:predicted RNA-binding Zn ribbon-like protein
MSSQYLDDRAKELKQGKNIFCRSEIAKALREVKYRHDREMYGAASKAIEDLEFLVSRIPACNPNSKLKQGPPRRRNSK